MNSLYVNMTALVTSLDISANRFTYWNLYNQQHTPWRDVVLIFIYALSFTGLENKARKTKQVKYYLKANVVVIFALYPNETVKDFIRIFV